MTITIRIAHMKARSPLNPGQVLKEGEILGIMGSTGKATSELHGHIDAIYGEHKKCFYTSQIRRKEYISATDQILPMLCFDLIKEPIKISHFPHGYEYYKAVGYHHEGFDVINKSYPPLYDIFFRCPKWLEGAKVGSIYFDEQYGNCVHFFKEV